MPWLRFETASGAQENSAACSIYRQGCSQATAIQGSDRVLSLVPERRPGGVKHRWRNITKSAFETTLRSMTRSIAF